MTDKQIIIDGLSCDNCPESKRCQEQQTKKEYAINQVLQDIPSECANVIDKLKQVIPSITRCDYVLEKQLKRKENELEELRQYHNKCCEKFKKEKQDLIDKYNQLSINFYNGDYCNTEHCSLLKSKEQECEELKEKAKELRQGWITCDKERNLQEANSEFRQRVINRYKQALDEIIRFFKEDEKFARYSGRPIIFAKPTLEKIEKILKENNIEIS